ncbi:threonylcarbamoyl-AMP synthase-like [Apostichopus japonicus]|uniref:threonylcarbamoyl-AMP synthase-like n=1 Tax=Stichopus japonicus TaxID=307972 RepID=UPI003AB634CB
MKLHHVKRLTRMAEILKLSVENDKKSYENVVNKAVKVLQSGGVIAVPTDTVYGLAALSQNSAAITKIYSIKGRHDEKPIAICVGDVTDISRWSKVSVPEDLLHDLLPGPVTVIFERDEILNPHLNPATDLVGIRVPDHSFIRRLSSATGSPLALTSANLSSAKSTLSVQEFQSLWPKLDLVVDGGVLSNSEASRAGSTVVDLSHQGQYTVVRPGSALSQTVSVLRDKYQLTER